VAALAVTLAAVAGAPGGRARADEETPRALEASSRAATRASTPRALRVGLMGGTLFLIGVQGALAFVDAHGRALFDAELCWEPSPYRQSYSVAAAWYPFGNVPFVAGRVRYLQLHAPWSRGFDARFDHALGLGLEVGLRDRLFGTPLVGTLALGFTAVLPTAVDLPVAVHLAVGLAWAFDLGAGSSAPSASPSAARTPGGASPVLGRGGPAAPRPLDHEREPEATADGVVP
jgi:hypothetical protein